jgi:hypothetical protein
MNHLQTETLIAAWRDDAETARKTGHEQTAREIEAAAGLFERQAAEIKTLRQNNEALQAELDDGHAELRDERDALAVNLKHMRDHAEYWINAAMPGSQPSKQEYETWLATGHHAPIMQAKPRDMLARRDRATTARATRHAASLAESEASSSAGEWQDAMHAFADRLDEVASMQESGDNGDAE